MFFHFESWISNYFFPSHFENTTPLVTWLIDIIKLTEADVVRSFRIIKKDFFLTVVFTNF